MRKGISIVSAMVLALMTMAAAFGSGEIIEITPTQKVISEYSYDRDSAEEIRLPERLLRLEANAFTDCYIGRIVIPKDFRGEFRMPQSGTTVEWIEVEEGNPKYRSVDGVLFSADGKTLIAYPAGKKETHYNVPKGTEEIGPYAFGLSYNPLPLKSISLPVGLKKIGAYAFRECGELLSLTVPLTVKEMAPSATAYCISLERFSAPEGMGGKLVDWIDPDDFTHFVGENGETLAAPAEKSERGKNGETRPARLDTADGTGEVPVYSNPGDREPVKTLPAGTAVDVWEMQQGRAAFTIGWDYLKKFWADPDHITYLAVNPFFEPKRAAFDAGLLDENGKPVPGEWTDYQASFYGMPLMETVDLWPLRVDETDPYADLDTEAIVVMIRDVRLLREKTGDGRTMGVLVSEGTLEPIPVLDAPGGTAVGHHFTGEQAEKLEEKDGWIRIRTATTAGWVEAKAFRIAEETAE